MTQDLSDTVYKVSFKANPVQRQFIRSRARADLFSSRVGEGKSAALCWACFEHTQHNPQARWAFVRDTWESLRDTTLKEFTKWFPPGVMGTWKASTKTFTWNVGEMRGEVTFLGMDDPSDASKLQSRELGGIAMDEPSPAAESGGIDELIFDMGMSRLRQTGMKWYPVKLAQNNSDENHWTYRKFVIPGTEGFRSWQTSVPENQTNLPPSYYKDLRTMWAHRPDLVRRFVDGKFGFQRKGIAVTPEWSDDLHLATGLLPVRGADLIMAWDFGLNPTCAIAQVTPQGFLYVLDAWVGEGIGVQELIRGTVKPCLVIDYENFAWWHTGDPNGSMREQSSSQQTAVKVIRGELGGRWRPGPVSVADRIDPLRAALSRTRDGYGIIRVDRDRAKPVSQALRGGWHYHVARTGVTTAEPVKDMASHPGDVMGYLAAAIFPLRKLYQSKRPTVVSTGADRRPSFFGQRRGPLGFERPGLVLPKEARTLPVQRKGV